MGEVFEGLRRFYEKLYLVFIAYEDTGTLMHVDDAGYCALA